MKTEFTFTYISSDTPDRTFTSTFYCDTLGEALKKFYDLCTSVDDETLTIVDIVMYSPAYEPSQEYDRTMPECDDDPYYRECRAATSGDEWSKADLIDWYSRYGMEDW